MRRVSVSWKTARALLDILPTHDERGRLIVAVDELRAAMPVKRSAKLARARKETKRKTKKAETTDIRAELEKRAGGSCECGCGQPFTNLQPSEMDHFFGRGKVRQSVKNTWLLRRDCHRDKTHNLPFAKFWLVSFAEHCRRHGYREEARKADQRREFVETRANFGAGI